MNVVTRAIILMGCLALCGGGLISAARDRSPAVDVGMENFELFTIGGYQLATTDTHKFNFGQLEAVIRADATTKSPRSRIEFGSVKVERGALVAQVMFLGPDHATQAYLYNLVPQNNSWKITRVQRLWFVPRSQLLRGLQV